MDRLKKIIGVLLPFGIVLMTLVAIWSFYFGVRRDIKEMAYETLAESTRQKSAAVLAVLNGKYATLDAFANTVALFGMPKEKTKILSLAKSCAKDNDFYLIGLSDTEGNALTSTGFSLYIGDRGYVTDALSGKRGLEHIAVARQVKEPRTLLSVPMYSGNAVSGMVFGSFRNDVLSEIIDENTYQGLAYSFLTDSQGNVIIISQSMPYELGENVLTYLSTQIQTVDDGSIEQITQDMSASASGTFSVTAGDERRFVCYTPLGLSDWYLFSGVPEIVAYKSSAGLTRRSTILALEVILLAVFAVAYIMAAKDRQNRQLAAEKEELRRSEERYRMVAELSGSILFEGDLATDTIVFNDNYSKVYGRQPHLTKISQLRDPHPYLLPEDADIFSKLYDQIMDGQPSGAVEYRIKTINGAIVWHRFEYKALFDRAGKLQRIIGRVSDVDEKRRMLHNLQLEADMDALTRILNRKAIESQINAFLADEGRDGMHALLVADVDDFKRINDTLGHVRGDQTLRGIAQNMSSIFRTSDLIGRLGGDEFVAFIKDIHTKEKIAEKARILCELSSAGGATLCDLEVTTSVGIAIYDADGRTFEELYERADAALYLAKSHGKRQYVFSGDECGQGE